MRALHETLWWYSNWIISLCMTTHSYLISSHQKSLSQLYSTATSFELQTTFYAGFKGQGGDNMNIKHNNENLWPGVDSWTWILYVFMYYTLIYSKWLLRYEDPWFQYGRRPPSWISRKCRSHSGVPSVRKSALTDNFVPKSIFLHKYLNINVIHPKK